jgi:hypothetical protein
MSTRCRNHHNILPLFGELEESLTFSSLLSYTTRHTHTSQKATITRGVGEGWLNAYLSTNPWGPIYSENKRLECPCELKEKLHLLRGNLVRLPLRHTRHHRTAHLLLHFHVTSMMMPSAPPTVTPSPVLRQN